MATLTERIKEAANVKAGTGTPASASPNLYTQAVQPQTQGLYTQAMQPTQPKTLTERIRDVQQQQNLYTQAAQAVRTGSGPSARSTSSHGSARAAGQYAGATQNADYAEKSQAGESKLKLIGGDQKYDYINNINGFRTQMDAQMRSGQYSKYTYMNDRERQLYNYLYATGGKSAAEDYLKQLEPQLNRQEYEATLKGATEAAMEHPMIAGGLTTAAQPIRTMSSMAALGQDWLRTTFRQGIDPYSPLRQMSMLSRDVRGNVAQEAEKNPERWTWSSLVAQVGEDTNRMLASDAAVKWAMENQRENPALNPFLDKGEIDNKARGEIASFIYQTALSAADSAVNGGVAKMLAMAGAPVSTDALMQATNTIGAALMSSEVASLGVAEGKQKGYSDAGALVLGLIRGGVEYASEAIGGDWVIKNVKQNPLNFAYTMALNMAPEAIEEVMSDVMNGIVNLGIDALFGTQESGIPKLMQEFSTPGWEKNHPMIAEIMEKINSKDPTVAVVLSLLGEELLSALGGALATVGSSGVQTYNIRQGIDATSKTLDISKETVARLMSEYNATPEEIADMAKLLEAKTPEEIRKKAGTGKTAREVIDETYQRKYTEALTNRYLDRKISAMSVDEDTRKTLKDNYAGGNVSVQAYAKGVQEALRMGQNGASLTQTVGALRQLGLSGEQILPAWQAGAQKAAKTAAEVEKAAEKFRRLRMETDGGQTRTGGLTVAAQDGVVPNTDLRYSAVNMSRLTDTQRATLDAVQSMARILGLDVTAVSAQGNFGGAYYQGGRIYLNIDSGMNLEGYSKAIAAGSFAHELTHWLKQYAPEEFQALQKIVTESMSTEQLDRLVREQMRSQPGLSYDEALEEVIANACQPLLQDSKAFEQLARQNMTLAEKILDFLKEFFGRIKDAFAEIDYKDNIPIYNAVRAVEGSLQEMQKAFDAAILAAKENMEAEREVNENTAQEGGAKLQAIDAHRNVVVDEEVDREQLRSILTAISEGKLKGDFTFAVKRITPDIYKVKCRLPGVRSLVMHSAKAAKAMLSRNSHDHGLGVSGLMEVIDGLDNPKYIVYERTKRHAGHYVAIIDINSGESVAAVEFGGYRSGETGTVNGEEGYYDALITAYNTLDEDSEFETFEDYVTSLIEDENNDVVYDREEEQKNEATEPVALSDRLSRQAAGASSEGIVTDTDGEINPQNQGGRTNLQLIGQPDTRVSTGTEKQLQSVGSTAVDGVVVSDGLAETMRTEGFSKPVDPLDDMEAKLQVWTTDDWESNYIASGGDPEVAAQIRAFTDDMIGNDAIMGYVPNGNYEKSKFGPLRRNIEYRWTFDMDASCPRTFQFVNYRNALQQIAGRPLTDSEALNLMYLMRRLNQQIPCTYCYVENKRVMKSKSYLDWFQSRSDVMNAATDEEALTKMYSYNADKGTVGKAAQKVFDEWRADVKAGKALAPTAQECWTAWNTAKNSVFNWMDRQLADNAFRYGKDVKKPTPNKRMVDAVCRQFGVTDKAARREIEGFVAQWRYDVLAGSKHVYGITNDTDVSEVNQDMLRLHRLASNYASSVSQARLVDSYIPNTDQLKNVSQEDKDYINAMGGIRKHSSNDFRMDYVQDYFLFYADLANNGWLGHTYTKSVDYCKVFGRTGDRINLSIAMNTENGKIVENQQEGAVWQDARELREAYPDVGVMAMVTDNAQLSFALNTDWIDMCIPFHASGLPKSVWYNVRAWSDYTSVQLESWFTSEEMRQKLRDAGENVGNLNSEEIADLFNSTFDIPVVLNKNGQRVKPHFFPSDTTIEGPNGEKQIIPGHHNDAKRYMELCDQYGVHPRFYGVKVTDADGNVIDVTEHPNYVKLIKETSRTDSKQAPIEFNFNEYDDYLGMTPMEYAMQRMQEEAGIGGYANTAQDPLGIVPMFRDMYLGKNRDVGWMPSSKDHSDNAEKLRAVLAATSNATNEMYDADVQTLDLEGYQKVLAQQTGPKLQTWESEYEDYDDNFGFIRPDGSRMEWASTDESHEELTLPGGGVGNHILEGYIRVKPGQGIELAIDNGPLTPQQKSAIGKLIDNFTGDTFYVDFDIDTGNGPATLGSLSYSGADIDKRRILDRIDREIREQQSTTSPKMQTWSQEAQARDEMIEEMTERKPIKPIDIMPDEDEDAVATPTHWSAALWGPTDQERETKAAETAAKAGNAALAEYTEDLPENPMDMYADKTPVEAKKAGAERMSARKKGENKTLKDRISDAWHQFIRSIVNEGDAIHQASLRTGNKALDGMFFYAKAATQRAQQWITERRMSADFSESGKSLNDIFDPIRDKGDEYYENFQLYMYHMLNIDRWSRSRAKDLQDAQGMVNDIAAQAPELATMSREQLKNLARQYEEAGGLGYEEGGYGELAQQYLDALAARDRAERKQVKPVFGWNTGADVSQKVVRDLLAEHPEFEQLAKDVYDYCDDLLQYRVDAGLITQEDAQRLKETYAHYIPVFYDVEGADAAKIHDGNISVSTTIKKAKGGDHKILPLHYALARQTLSVMRNAGYEQLASEIYNEYDKNPAAMGRYVKDVEETPHVWDEDMADNDDSTEPYENAVSFLRDGTRYTLTLEGDMSYAFQSIKGNLDKGDIKPLRGANDLFKKLCTAYNPLFMLTNPVRDIQDALFYSTDTKRWLQNYPKAISQIAGNGKYWQMYTGMGAVANSYYDWATAESDRKMGKIEALNMAIEQAPRLAEFMTVLENAERNHGSITNADRMEAFNAAQEVTTNFGRGGTMGKWINRNIVPFWNPGVQGLSKAVRTAAETKGFKAWAALAIKAAALGILPELLNGWLYRDDDEWDKIDDQMKMEYYLFKGKDGVWIKIPKGRVLAALSMPAVGAQETLRGDDVNWGGLTKQAFGSIAPNNPLRSNILSALFESEILDKNAPGRTWYGGNIESKRLQNYAPGERYDESTDIISKWIGGKLNVSPKKLSYILDQYSGVIGDVILPYLTPKAERGWYPEALGGNIAVPLSNAFMSRFTTDTVTSNTISDEYYDLMDELGYGAKRGDDAATMAQRYMSRANSRVSEIYAEIRKIENDTELTDREKTTLTRELRKELNDYEQDVTARATEYFTAAQAYLAANPELDYTDDDRVDAWMDAYNDLQTEEKYQITADQAETKMKNEAYREINREVYGAEYALEVYDKDVYAKARTLNEESGLSYDDYYDYYFGTQRLYADKDEDGKSISGSKKEKVVDYIANMDIPDEQKDALYIAAGYAEKSLGTTPWHGGSGKYTTSGGRRGSGRKKAAAKPKAVGSTQKATTPGIDISSLFGGTRSGTGLKKAAGSDLAEELGRIIDRYYGGDIIASAVDGGRRARVKDTVDFKL